MPAVAAPTAERLSPHGQEGPRGDAAPAAPEPPARPAWRRALAALGRVLAAPPAAGAYVFLALFAAELVAVGQLGMMGVHDEEVTRLVFGRFGRFIALEQLALAAGAAALGLAFGLAAAGALRLWDLARGRRLPLPADGPVDPLDGPSRFARKDGPRASRARTGPRRRWLTVAGVVLAVHLWRVAVTIIRYPQLYDELLYARGGARRALQLLLTHRVPLVALEVAGWLAVAVLVLGPAFTARGRAFILRLASSLHLRLRARRLALAGAAAALAAVAVAAAVASPRRAHAVADRPSVLVLAVDSLRADRVGPGHEAVTPHLSALAARGVHFTAAHVTVPRTFPSWVTLLTGRWPARHGIRTMFPSAAERRAIGPALPSLLARAGWSTTVVSDFAGEIFSRIDVGFTDRRVPWFDFRTVVAQMGVNLHPGLYPYVASRLGHRLVPPLAAAADNADPERLADDVIAALEEIDEHADGPFFLTAFFSTAHFPYAAPDPWYRRFTDDDYRGRFRYHKPPPVGDVAPAPVTDEDVAQVQRLYDGAAAATDAAIGRVLDALARRGLDRRTIIVLVADHGENLYEPGRGMGHGEHLRGDKALHIPLVIVDPVHRFPAHRAPGIVRDVDLAPTLAALCGQRIEDTDGVDLTPMLRGDKDDLDLTAFAETGLWFTTSGPGFAPGERLPYPPVPTALTLESGDDIVLRPELRERVIVAKHRALRTSRWKLLYQPTPAGVRRELYDLAADPDERRDVAAQNPDVLADLSARLTRWSTLGGWRDVNGFVLPP